MVPLLSISLAVAGLVIDQADVEQFLSSLLGDVFETDATAFTAEVGSTIDTDATVGSLGLLGLGSLILTASLVFVALQDAFDVIWEVPVARGTWSSVRRRMVAFAVVFLAGAVMVVSFAVVGISNLLRGVVPGSGTVVDVVADVLASLSTGALLAAVIGLLFHFLTRRDLGWKVSAIGGAATALTLTVGNRLFLLYVQGFGSSSLVGAAGSILVGLVWIYSIAQIVLAGAELTRTLQGRLPVRFTSGRSPGGPADESATITSHRE